jgi:hypothetical protein
MKPTMYQFPVVHIKTQQITSSGLARPQAINRRPFIEEALVLGSVHVAFIVDKWQWNRFFFEFYGFPLSISFHHGSMLIYHVGNELYPLVAAVQRHHRHDNH